MDHLLFPLPAGNPPKKQEANSYLAYYTEHFNKHHASQTLLHVCQGQAVPTIVWCVHKIRLYTHNKSTQ